MKLAGFVIGSLAMLATTAFAAEYKFKLAHEVAVEFHPASGGDQIRRARQGTDQR